MAMNDALHVRELKKGYGAAEILAGVSLAVREGEFFALVGVNGAGKTTLIKCLLDFCEVQSGAIEIFGLPHRHRRARARLAFLPERFVAPYYLSGREFLRYMSRLYGAAPPDGAALAAVAGHLDLDPVALDKPVRALSKGMAQKLGLAAVLLSGRDLLVLDEPMSGLDPKARALLKAHLRALRDRGRSLFFSTHLLADVEALCDRMAILHGGRLRFVGSPAECRERFGAASLEAAYLRCVESV